MSDVQDAIITAITEQELNTGGTVTWGGITVPCAGGIEFSKVQLGIGGFQLSADVQIMVRVNAFPPGNLPKDKQTVTYISAPGSPPNRLKIECVDPYFGVALILNCNHIAQGA